MFVDAISALFCIHFCTQVFTAFTSLVIDFHIPVNPPRYPACQYLRAFHITGVATAPIAHHSAALVAMSFIVASLHLSSIGCIPPNPAPTTADLPINHCDKFLAHCVLNNLAHCNPVIPFAPARYPPPIGDTARATSGA